MNMAITKSEPRDTIRALTTVSRSRALTVEESDRLATAHYREHERQKRLPDRIIRLRALLHSMESELWPEYAHELVRLQDLYSEDRRQRLDQEFLIHWGPEHHRREVPSQS